MKVALWPSVPRVVTMPYTKFETLYATTPFAVETWEEFTTDLCDPVVTDDKYSPWMYSSAIFIPGTTRANANVQYCTMFIADIDRDSYDQVLTLLEFINEADVETGFHTTHSNKEGQAEGKFKCRFLFPTSRPVMPHEWDRAWEGFKVWVYEVSGCRIDEKCKDPSRAYFAPSGATREEIEVAVFAGDFLDVDLILDMAPEDAGRTTIFESPPEEFIQRIETNTRYKMAKRLVEAMPAAVEGEHGDAQTLQVAFVGNDYALTPDEFWPILVEYNKKCRPPWNERDLRRKLENAYKYSSLPRGWRLVGAGQDDIIELSDIESLVKRLLKKDYTAPTARILRSMIMGEALAVNDAKNTWERIGKTLGKSFPHAAPGQLADLFAPCVEATMANDKDKKYHDITVGSLMVQIREAQAELQAHNASQRLQIQDTLTNKYYKAFRTIGETRISPYSDEEIEAMREQFARPAQLDQSWIVRYGDSYYYRVVDQYIGPFGKDAWNGASLCLAPVTHISLYEYTQNGRHAKSMATLVEEYGTVALSVNIDMTRQEATFDHESLTMHEAPCPIRTDLEAEYNEDVNRWLFLLCNENVTLYNKLLDWLATLLILDQPTAALVLYGKPQTGKTLMGFALSRLFCHTGPTEVEDVAGAFNSKLSRCPIVLADETVPKDGREPHTKLLRKLITANSRTLKRKFIPDSDINGCLRLVMTANNIEGLISFENINEDDIEALCERFLLIRIATHKPRDFLDSLPPKRRQAITHGDAIPKHVLWLCKERDIENWGTRCIVEGFRDSELAEALRSGTGIRPEIIEFIANWITGRRMQKQEHQPLVHKLPDGKMALLMTAKGLKEHWKAIMDDDSPKMKYLSKALEALSIENLRVESRNYWSVDVEVVRRFATTQQGFDSEEFDQGLRNLGLLPILSITPKK